VFHFVCARCVLPTVSVVADDRTIGGVFFFIIIFLLCAQCLTASVISGQGGERFSVLQRTQARGFKGNFGTLKQKTGCFFSDRSLSRLNFLFSLDFLRNDIFSPHGLYKGGVAGEVRYRVSFRINPCAERASACQARACIGAEGFIHSEESVPRDSVNSEQRDKGCTWRGGESFIHAV